MMTATRYSSLRPYLIEINATPLLTADDERELAERIAEGDAEARDHLVRANLRLVVNIAGGYLHRGLALEDLVAEGNLGLMRAAEGFDPAFGVRFSTYASYWVKQSIRRAVLNQGKPVRVPHYAVSLLANWKRAAAILAERLGREPGPEEVGRLLDLTPKKVRIVQEALSAERSFAAHEGGDEDEGPELSSSPGPYESPLEKLVAKDDYSRLHEGLAQMGERYATIIRMRFGLATGSPLTLREVGDHLGLTRERVRQLKKYALAYLMEFVAETPRFAMA